MPTFHIKRNTFGQEETHNRMRINSHGLTRINYLKLKVIESKTPELKKIFQKAINEIIELTKKCDAEVNKLYKEMKRSPNNTELTTKLQQRIVQSIQSHEKNCSSVMKGLDTLPLPDTTSIKNNLQ